jgi:hypothetical protein
VCVCVCEEDLTQLLHVIRIGISSLTNLRRLQLNHNEHVVDCGLVALTNLTSLSLSYNDSITEKSGIPSFAFLLPFR